jgi:hypothetical protein
MNPLYSMKITLSSIKEIFNRMSDAGVNVRKPLLWGFFIVSSSSADLDTIVSSVSAWGYKYVERVEDERCYRFHFEKIEIHTPETLFEACERFASLEGIYEAVLFDGYDVGNPDKNLPITDVK